MKVLQAKYLPKEDQECFVFSERLDLLVSQKKVLCFSHVPNETSIKSIAYLAKMKRMGKRAGVPDFIIVLPNKTLFVEMKRRKNENGTSASTVKKEQLEWIQNLNNANCPSAICYGADEAITFVLSHI